MKLLVFYFFALAWSLGQSRGIGVGSDRTTDDDIEQDAKIEEQNDAEATVEVEEAEEEVITVIDALKLYVHLIINIFRFWKQLPRTRLRRRSG